MKERHPIIMSYYTPTSSPMPSPMSSPNTSPSQFHQHQHQSRYSPSPLSGNRHSDDSFDDNSSISSSGSPSSYHHGGKGISSPSLSSKKNKKGSPVEYEHATHPTSFPYPNLPMWWGGPGAVQQQQAPPSPYSSPYGSPMMAHRAPGFSLMNAPNYAPNSPSSPFSRKANPRYAQPRRY